MRQNVKKQSFILAVMATLALSGCASMWRGMGVATVASVKEVSSKVDAVSANVDNGAKSQAASLAELKATIDDLSTKMDQIQKSKDDITRIDALVVELRGKIDQLPRETLRQLADILSRAADEAQRASK